LKWSTTLGTVRKNKVDTSIIIPDFKSHSTERVRNPKSTSDSYDYPSYDYPKYLCINYRNTLSFVTSNSLQRITGAKHHTDGVRIVKHPAEDLCYLLYRSICVNVIDSNTEISQKQISEKTYSYLKNRLWEIKENIDKISENNQVTFVFTDNVRYDIISQINDIFNNFKHGDYKHKSSLWDHHLLLHEKICTISVLLYLGSREFLNKIENIETQQEEIQVKVPSEFITLAFEFFKKYFLKRTEYFIKYIPDTVNGDFPHIPKIHKNHKSDDNENTC